MRHRHAHRLAIGSLVALSLLFSQLAWARYPCAGQNDRAAMARMMAAGQPCEGMDGAQPTLCDGVSPSAATWWEAIKVPVPALAIVIQVLTFPVVPEADATDALVTGIPEARPPPDPLFLSTLRLRV